MSADWQVGDLALCVDGAGWMLAIQGVGCKGPAKGSINTVRQLRETRHGAFLSFTKWPGQAFYHKAFVKVTPPREMIEAERKVEVPA